MTIGCDGYTIGIKTKEGRGSAHYELIWEIPDNITSSVLYHWKKQYSRGKFNNEPTEEGALQDRIEKLERLVGKLPWRMSF